MPIPTLAVFPVAGFFGIPAGNYFVGCNSHDHILAATGATIGTSASYLIALKFGRIVLLRYLKYIKVSEKKLERVEIWFERYGDKAVFLGRVVPLVRELISIPAGLLKMRPLKFIIYTFAGSCIWSSITILSGYYFGESLVGMGAMPALP